ncbi:unnamed protein product, partial [Timema podura]|nr:unnamed protein product [Timema podura]
LKHKIKRKRFFDESSESEGEPELSHTSTESEGLKDQEEEWRKITYFNIIETLENELKNKTGYKLSQVLIPQFLSGTWCFLTPDWVQAVPGANSPVFIKHLALLDTSLGMTKASQSLGCDTPEKRCGNAAFTGASLLVYRPSVRDNSP